jgi:hypothetical protein
MKPSSPIVAVAAVSAAIASFAIAQTPPAPAAPAPAAAKPAVSYPAPTCVAPKYPGKSRTDQEVDAFNRDFKDYGDCMKQYVDTARATSNAAIEAGNKAVDDYNAYTGEVKKMIAAEKDDAPQKAEKSKSK